MKPDTTAIIVAGGKGLRYGGKVRKQYLLLHHHPILWWSISAFAQSASILTIIVVVPSGDLSKVGSQVKNWAFRKPVSIVAGGETRTDSVSNGLDVAPIDGRYVAVHDAVRPLVTPHVIETVIKAARQTNAALAAYPSKDTVKLADSKGFVKDSPHRETVWLAQTPQIFDRRLLERAYRQKSRASTDDAQLVERLGIKVKLVKSIPENIKVTVPMDFEMAKIVLKERGLTLTPSLSLNRERENSSSFSLRREKAAKHG